MRRVLPVLAVLFIVALPAGIARADERCGSPLVAGGQPALVAVVMDGIGSQELDSGTSDPLAVSNWCPALPDGSERRLPAGLDVGFRTWAGLATSDGQKPQTQTCRPAGGLAADACLVARLADAGAIVLPYSYAGSRVTRDDRGGSRFAFSGYAPQVTYQDPATSIAQLDGMLRSIASAWPAARVVIVAHSYGGTVASGWWLAHAKALGNVEHVVTLDSPINGIEQCNASALLFSQSVADELCRRWNNRDAFDQQLLAQDTPTTLTTIGTADDPTYEPSSVAPDGGLQIGGGGRLRAQVVYRCPDEGVNPASPCVAAPPSVVSADAACSGAGPGVMGRSGHFAVIGCPRTSKTVLAVTSTGLVVARGARPSAPGAGDVRPGTLRVGRRLVRAVSWKGWGAGFARGVGRLAGRRRAITLSRPLPCAGVHRFAYTRVQVHGLPPARRTCPSRLGEPVGHRVA